MVSQVAKKKEERNTLTRPSYLFSGKAKMYFLFLLLLISHYFRTFDFLPPPTFLETEKEKQKWERSFFALRGSWKSGHFSTKKGIQIKS